ncbi:MAG: hypothetical protein IKX00_04680 [Bacilli bacterium]|nr:hypothetical protein [Bacilli bacterium]
MLSIDNSTIGYDVEGMKNAIGQINSEVIGAAQQVLLEGADGIERSIKDVWVGASADQFVKNIQDDRRKVSYGLDQAFMVFKDCVNQIIEDMDTVDATIVSDRSGDDL